MISILRPVIAAAFAFFLASSFPVLAAGGKTDAQKATPPAPAAKSTVQPSGDGKVEAIDQAKQYSHCVALARQNPTEGWEEALAWGSLGGGEPARHCGAIALFGLKQYEEAATRFEELAQSSHREAVIRAGMLAQAGQAWLLAKRPERAYAAQTSALQLVPGASDLLVDRAESLAEAKNYKDAIADLDKALASAPSRVDALTFRASAKRYVEDLAGAEADAKKALSIDPSYVDAWLESGMIHRLNGQDQAARADWMKVLELAPNSPTGDMARRNIELLDVKSR